MQRSIAFYGDVFRHYAGLHWHDVRSRAGAFVDAIDAYDVQILPELEGIAEGAGVDAEDVLAINLRTEIMFGLDARTAQAAAKECTTLCAPGATGPILAQNWDWKPATRETCVLLACAPTGRPGFVTFVEAGLLAKCGMNETGVAVTTNALVSSLDRGAPGIPYHAVLRHILTSSTVEEAVDSVIGGPRASSANYMIAHRDGGAVDIEAAPGGPDGVRAIHGERLVHANHFLWPQPRAFKDLGRIDGAESLHRQAVVEGALLPGGVGRPFTVEEAEANLRDHAGSPGAVCAHEDPALPPVEDYVTVASWVADTGSGIVHVTEGNPCERPYASYTLEALMGSAREPSLESGAGLG